MLILMSKRRKTARERIDGERFATDGSISHCCQNYHITKGRTSDHLHVLLCQRKLSLQNGQKKSVGEPKISIDNLSVTCSIIMNRLQYHL